MKSEDVKLKGFKILKKVDEVRSIIAAKIEKNDEELISTENALGRIIAKDMYAQLDVPHFNRSAMDGYAVKAEDTFGASIRNPKKLKIIDKIRINEISSKIVENGTAIEIPTGAPIPEGANAVIKLEDTKNYGDYIEVYFPITPYKNISKIGEDVKKGDLIIRRGSIIRPQEITLLLACNILEIPVVKKPKVAIITSGSELINVGSKPNIGQIIETNSYSIASLCKIYGGVPYRLGIVKDDYESLKNILEKALNYDIVVFTGGSSVGEYDLIPQIVNEHPSCNLFIHGIAMRPGSPTAIAFIKNTPIFCLPGFPVATMISFETFVGFTIRKMLGANELDPRPVVKAVLNRQIPSKLGRRDFVRVKLSFDSEKMIYIAEPIRSSGSGIISSMVKADGILEIPENLEGYEVNSEILIKLFLPR